MKSRIRDQGLYRPAHRWTFDGSIGMDEPLDQGELDFGEEPPA